MNYKVTNYLNFVPCLFTPVPNSNLEQKLFFDKFLDENTIQDIADQNANESHECIILTYNHQYLSCQRLFEDVTKHSKNAGKYLCVKINKFYLYTYENIETHKSLLSFDENLVTALSTRLSHCFNLKTRYFRVDDTGTLGNFQYPATIMIYERIQ